MAFGPSPVHLNRRSRNACGFKSKNFNFTITAGQPIDSVDTTNATYRIIGRRESDHSVIYALCGPDKIDRAT
jgi:hypothetical protein